MLKGSVPTKASPPAPLRSPAPIGGANGCAARRRRALKSKTRLLGYRRAAEGSSDSTTETAEGGKTALEELAEAEKSAELAAKKVAATFAPRPSGRIKNPAVPGTLLYDLFGYQAVLGAVAGGLLSFNVLFPSDQPSIAKLIGMWSIWMFSVPSLRARECTPSEKEVLNILFLLLPAINVVLPFAWKSFPFVFSADVLACGAVYVWKMGLPSNAREAE